MVMKKSCNSNCIQFGAALLIMMLILIILSSTFLLSIVSGNNAKFEREKKTSAALVEAKNALLGYATSINLFDPLCTVSCSRPGDLPCPDINNDGLEDAPCQLGRLPWKTLGLDDLRDGNGDRLWYAVSNRFKHDNRVFPLNSDTAGTISIRDENGNLLQDATGSTGSVAVVISVGKPIIRQDTTVQLRTLGNENNAAHYLDNALGEDNADFIDGGANGFIKGVINDANGNPVLNDQLILVSQSDMMNAIEPRVAREVVNAVSTYFSVNSFYPSPAIFSDVSCLGKATIAAGFCLPNSTVNGGRVPANPSPSWNATSFSFLIGTANNNWFQQNGWRELIYYSNGVLTFMPGTISKNIIVIATGPVIGPQIRALNTDKILESNYLELENLTPLDKTYLRLPTIQHNNTFNDFTVSLP
jgi:hypothetical protein